MSRKTAVFRNGKLMHRLDAEQKRVYGDIHVRIGVGSSLFVGWVDKNGILHESCAEIKDLPLPLHVFEVISADTPFCKMYNQQNNNRK